MAWLKLCCDSTLEDVSRIEEFMLATGALSVTLEDNADEPLLEPGVGETPLWQQTRVTGLYEADSDMAAVLAGFPPELAGSAHCRVEILEDRDWEREWMRHYRPMQFGPNFWVCPSWLEPPDPQATNLLLDPGLAFGTGTHPTTALCLSQLAELPLRGAAVVDYGCGSGILAVAAGKLGAQQVLAVDNDPQAIRATRENATRNGLRPDCIRAVLPGGDGIDSFTGCSDVVVANILAGPLQELMETLCGFLKPGGTLLLSGLISSQAEPLQQHYAPLIALEVRASLEDWICLRGEKAG